jgi:hypothetical protein
MIIAGWGKKGKEIAYYGMMKCPACRNHCDHRLYEYSNRVTLYFVPVAKFNVKHVLVCDICDAGREMDPKKKDEVMQQTLNIPGQGHFHHLWNELKVMYHQSFEDIAQERIHPSAIFEHLETTFKHSYNHLLPERQLDYVYSRFVLFVTDDDLPK